MKNSYEYIDHEYTYTDPKTGILRNTENIENHSLLVAFESLKVSRRLEELKASPLKIKNSATLLEIHKYLFQDVYLWAGKTRRVEISKAGKQFFPTSHFNTAFAYIDNLVSEYRTVNKKEKHNIAGKLAEILDSINYLHPFREGNGRTQREFIRLLALEKGYILNLNPADNQSVYDRYMSGTINGDIEKLTDLISEILKEKIT